MINDMIILSNEDIIRVVMEGQNRLIVVALFSYNETSVICQILNG